MPLRIVHVDTSREWRVAQRQLFALAAAQRQQGHEPLVVAHPDGLLVRRLRAHGMAAAVVRVRSAWDPAAARRVRQLARAWRADLVHAHDDRAHTVAHAALLGTHTARLVVTRRSPAGLVGRIRRGPRVAQFIAISGAVRESLERVGIAPDRISLVYPGVPVPRVAHPRDWRRECQWPDDALVCAVIGGPLDDTRLRALATIGRHVERDVRDRVHLVVLGDRALGQRLVGPLRAYIAGSVDDVDAAIARADLLWYPFGGDGFCTGVLWAMALGVPAIAFAHPVLREVVRHEVDGLLVPQDNLAAFGRAVSVLARDPALRARLADNARHRARDFSVERMVQDTERAYAAALRAPDPRRA